MPRQALAAEISRLVGGLNTEASPLTFPEGDSVDEANFVLNKNGTRSRRLGMDYEEDSVDTEVLSPLNLFKPATTTFTWNNAGGVPENSFLVVQRGIAVLIYDLSITPLSSGLLSSTLHPFTDIQEDRKFSFASIDSVLVMTSGVEEITVFEFSDAVGVTFASGVLLIRDIFGLEDERINKRPVTLTNNHLYNLRNQGWSLPKLVDDNSNAITIDPISWFQEGSKAKYPSNADNIELAIFPNPQANEEPLLDKFHRNSLSLNTPQITPAPKGSFIIEALGRGASRLSENEELEEDNPELDHSLSSDIPDDKTTNGATCVGEYAGRVWYGGFTGIPEDGDTESPNLSSYIFFSQLVNSISSNHAASRQGDKLFRCYQEGNPTDSETAELLATDGGIIRIAGAYGIKAFVDIDQGLVVLAENGVWIVSGGNNFGFDATNILVTKVTSHGCIGIGSIVEVDSTVMYWGSDGIYHIRQNEDGVLVTDNITDSSIKTFYEDIPYNDKVMSEGLYDSLERKVRWVYGNRVGTVAGNNAELVLDMTLGAFYPNVFSQDGSGYPQVLSLFRTNPYTVGSFDENIVLTNGTQVVVGADEVTIGFSDVFSTQSEVKYLIQPAEATIEIRFLSIFFVHAVNFGGYIDTDFTDWETQYGVGLGIDAPAHMITGYGPGGDFQRNKQFPWVTFHFLKTEVGFEDDGTGTLVPINPGSCLVQTQWDWTNSVDSNRWGTEFQAYRHKRLFIPSGAGNTFNDGNLVISTKNKMRGKGKVLSLLIQSEPGKDLQLLGLSSILAINSNV